MHASPRHPRVALSFCLLLLFGACGGGDGPTGPLPGQPGVRAVAGAGITDTVDTQPIQALVVEVRDPDGQLASGVVVRFEPQPPADPSRRYEPAVFTCSLSAQSCGLFGGSFVTDTTDSQGRAKATVRLGHVAGKAVVRLVVPEFGLLDSATFTVTPGVGVGVRAPSPDTALDIGATATLRGHVVDRYYNARTEPTTVSAGPGNAFTLDVATAVVTARDMGTQWLFTRYNSLVDSMTVRVVPTGRLVVWSSNEQAVRLVDLNGGNERTLVTNVSSDYGAFPSFDPSRHRVTLHAGGTQYGGPPNNLIVIDTTGSPRRNVTAAVGFSVIMSSREMADGTVLLVATRDADASHPGFSLWRLATDNAVTFVTALPELGPEYGGADISHNGARVVYSASGELRVLNISNGATTVIDPSGASPRWSAQDDRVAFLAPYSGWSFGDFVVAVINADGSGRKQLGNATLSQGLAWSPDGKYVVGRNSGGYAGLRLLRVSDGADVLLRFNSASGCCHDYWQPDWR